MVEIRSINALRANKENDNSLLSPVECLEDAIQDIKSGNRKCDKLLVLMLNSDKENGGGGYEVGFAASDMKTSEMISLMEAAKYIFLQRMGF